MLAGPETRVRLTATGEAIAVAGVALLVGGFALLANQRLGVVGLLLPFAAVGMAVAIRFPVLAVFGAVAAAILGEGTGFELLPATSELYRDLGFGVMPIDVLFMVAVLAVALRSLRDRRPLILPPRLLTFAIVLLLLALAGGCVVAYDAGVSPTAALLATHHFVYVGLLPLLVVNLGLDERQVKRVLAGAVAVAVVKAVLGLAAIASGRGIEVDGSVLTYYQPVANWLTMLTALAALAAIVMRAKPPAWLLLALPLVTASLLLSYRRSFWIGFGLAVVVLVLFGLSPSGRRLILPIGALLAVAIWMLGSVAVQSDGAVAQRLQSLSPTKVTTKPEDRYRLDERANVVAELQRRPISGLGLDVPWRATEQPLPVEVNPEHTYVHFSVLFWWLKLGALGLAAWIATMASALALSWRVWRRSREPLMRAVGLASLCGVIGLLAIETTGSFTGVDLRFTIAFGAQLGLLAVMARQADAAAAVAPAADEPSAAVP